ncbi:MAG: Sulfotransferase family [Rhodobacteraceae bacterium HLUCCA12]|nr:MAG: Sulfotransferase family [Rhodobacteraceae bacterium HLUCCA12]
MKALIHIGTPKSGTTSIQAFLRRNQEKLRTQGFRCEPFDPGNLAQMELATVGVIRAGGTVKEANKRHALGVGDHASQEAYVDRYEAMLREGARNWPEHTYLASGEQVHSWLSSPERITALDTFLHQFFDEVRYLVYYRPQEEFMVSTYSERIKRGELVTFEEHFEQRLKKMNYWRKAQMWTKIVGKDRFIPRLMARDALAGGDLLDDFCTIAGIDREPLATPPRMNLSLSAEEMALYLKLGRIVPARKRSGAPNRIFDSLFRIAQRRLPKPGSKISLTDAQRQQIRKACAGSNEKLRAAFFPDRADLFTQS